MEEIIKCECCGETLRLEENLFFFEEEKTTEVASCPCCHTSIREKEMSGWFFVGLYKSAEQVVSLEFPMP
jgi:NAD-dependent SIR2 family protein deacetylase